MSIGEQYLCAVCGELLEKPRRVGRGRRNVCQKCQRAKNNERTKLKTIEKTLLKLLSKASS